MKHSDKEIPILFEDNHMLVVHKEAGLLVQPTDKEKDCLLLRLKAFIKKRDVKPGNVFLEPIHRIDKPVSGIVVFAKTSKALSRMMQSVREKRCKKVYRAIVSGKLLAKEGILEHDLVHGEFRSHISKEGKKAVLRYKVLKRMDSLSVIEIILDTGRYHQIRVQFAAIGCPIVGDIKYGSKCAFKKGEIALHHFKFMLPHPISKKELEFVDSTFDDKMRL